MSYIPPYRRLPDGDLSLRHADGFMATDNLWFYCEHMLVYTDDYIRLHKRGLKLVTRACLWYDLTGNYIFHEAGTTLRT
jgi:hypothetical protein